MDKHIQLFDSIARPYGWLHQPISKKYIELLAQYLNTLDIETGSRVLDVGCGPGSFGMAFKSLGFEVVGVDGSPKMASISRSNGLECHVADATVKLPFPDGSFDLVAAAFLAHGFPVRNRRGLYQEMKRVSTGLVLLHDFSPASQGFSPVSVIGLLEKLEGSDYVNFRRSGLEELEKLFQLVTVLPIHKRASWYICRGGAEESPSKE